MTILGSGAAIPTLLRNCTAQYITVQNKHILIDCGEGTQLQMRKFGVKIQRISIVLISHLHGDHFFGLVGLISTMRLLGRDKNLTIIGTKGLKTIILSQLQIGYVVLDFEIEFIELTGKDSILVYEDNAIQIHSFPLKHKIPTSGFRIQEKTKERALKKDAMLHPDMKIEHIHRLKRGEDVVADSGVVLQSTVFTKKAKKSLSYAYCSDTAYSENVIKAVEGTNVLYHEATFLEEHISNAKKTMHSTAKQAATVAAKAEVGQLLMGHLSARYDDGAEHEAEAREVFENSVFVNDGDVFLVK